MSGLVGYAPLRALLLLGVWGLICAGCNYDADSVSPPCGKKTACPGGQVCKSGRCVSGDAGVDQALGDLKPDDTSDLSAPDKAPLDQAIPDHANQDQAPLDRANPDQAPLDQANPDQAQLDQSSPEQAAPD